MKTILDYIIENNKDSRISFSAPGHKGRRGFYDRTGYGEFCHSTLTLDIAEMQDSEGTKESSEAIRISEEYYADLYGVLHTKLLPSGVASGLAASILTCVPDGGQLILARNQNPAVFDAMRLGNITPYYLTPEINKETGLFECISPSTVRKACKACPDATAVLISSPTYYGAMSDIAVIAEVVHKNGMVLIVDQTYGAHLKFFDVINETCTSAEEAGADIVINGLDQNLLGYSGAAIMNICSDRVSAADIEVELRASRPLMPFISLAGMDMNEKVIRRQGRELFTQWIDDLDYVYAELQSINGLDVLTCKHHDATKIAISMKKCGVSSEQLSSELKSADIVIERIFGDYILLQTGAGNCRSDYEALIRRLEHVAKYNGIVDKSRPQPDKFEFSLQFNQIPRTKSLVPLYMAEGRTLSSSIIAYPPATPIACPGEVLTRDVIAYIVKALENGKRIDGIDDEGYIFVGQP